MEAPDASYQHRGLVHGSDGASHSHLIGFLRLQVDVGVPGDQEVGSQVAGVGWGSCADCSPPPCPILKDARLSGSSSFALHLPRPSRCLGSRCFLFPFQALKAVCLTLHTLPGFNSHTCADDLQPLALRHDDAGTQLYSPLDHMPPRRAAGGSCSPQSPQGLASDLTHRHNCALWKR